MDDLESLDPDLYDHFAQRYAQAQRATVDEGMDHDPDKAVNAMQLSDLDGTPPQAILQDYDEHTDMAKRAAAQSLVLDNPELVAYMQSHPMAATVSNDDWAQLDKLTRESAGPQINSWRLPTPWLDSAVDAGLKGVVEGFQQGGIDFPKEMQDAMNPSVNKLGVFGAVASKAVYGGADLGSRIMGAMAGGTIGAAEGLGQAVDESVVGPAATAAAGVLTGGTFGGSFKQEFGEDTEKLLNNPGIPSGGVMHAGAHVEGAGLQIRAKLEEMTGADFARPWLQAGKEPLAGLHPEIDKVKSDVNSALLDAIEKDLANAQASTTHERSPEMFNSVVQRLYGNAEIEVRRDAVAALYGEKMPEAGDKVLGFVPDIAEQWTATADTGDNIRVPIKDWLTSVDPEVAKTLRPDTKVLPLGITENDAKLAGEPRQIVDEAVPNVRAAAGLEPRFSVGDRKISLVPGAIEAGDQFHPEVHSFDLHDEQGQSVGNLEIIPGPDKKGLYVNWIGGQAGLWANSFGPSLIRDIKRQLKGMYPDYEYLTGHRVSGAREGVDNFGPMPVPKVKLDVADLKPEEVADDYRNTKDLFFDGFRGLQGRGVGYQNIGRMGLDSQHLASVITEEARRIAGPQVEVRPTGAIANEGGSAYGAYVPSVEKSPLILVDIDQGAERATHTLRHEAVHHLRQYNILSDAEWGTLSDTAKAEGWLDRFGIHERYAGLSDEAKIEEAIADGYGEWKRQGPDVRPTTGVGAIFQKISDFFDAIKKRLGFGPEDTWEDIFKKIDSGEVAMRGPQESREGAFDLRQSVGELTPKFSVEDQRKADIEGVQNLQAAAVGMSKPTFAKLMEAVQKQADEGLEIAKRQAIKEQTKRQTDEWKTNATAMRADVSKEIHQRPDVAADLFLGNGEMFGNKLRQRYTLRGDALTPEQIASLPAHYVSKNGLHPDAVAGLFGYDSGEEMVRGVSDLNKMKVDAEGKPIRSVYFLRNLINAETNRRMEMKYGDLGKTILDNAMEQALSAASINVKHQELQAAAEMAGTTVFDKATMQKAVERIVSETPLNRVNSYRVMQEMGRSAKAAEAAMAKGDFAKGVVHMQQQTLSMMVAREFKALEKEVGAAVKEFNSLRQREIKSLPEEYTNWIHDILGRTGFKVKRKPEDLQRAIAAQSSGDTLAKFVAGKQHWLQDLAVSEDLQNPAWEKDFETLTADEFRAVRDSVKSLKHVGREEGKIYRQGEAEDYAAVRDQLVEGLTQFAARPEKGAGEGPVGGNRVSEMIRTFKADLLQVENIFGHWDKFDPQGVWSQYVMRDLVRGVNQSDAWKKEFAKRIRDINDKEDMNQGIENTLLKAPEEYGGYTLQMTRGNFRAVLLNMGNASNLNKFARGWGVEPKMLRAWAMAKATKSDLEFAQGVWDIFKDMKERSDTMYRSMAGVPAANVEPTPLVHPVHGTFPGGYYPMIYHETFAKIPKLQEVGLQAEGWEGATPPAGFLKDRTGFAAPVSLNLDRMPNRLSQMIHDTAVRPAVLNAAKVFRDPAIQGAMTLHYGREYTKMMIPWLRGIANAANKAGNEYSGPLEFLRQGLISNMTGFGLGTIAKHAPTALGFSAFEVGPLKLANELWGVGGDSFRNAVHSLTGLGDKVADDNWNFAKEHSLELQRRERNWQETLYGASGELVPGSSIGAFRQKMMQWSSKPLAFSDMISAVPTWLARYNEAMGEGFEHGDAVDLADRAVRRAHGSNASTNRPMIASKWSPWLTSVYNFFNDDYNRLVETAWKAGETAKLAKSGQYDKAMKMAGVVVVGAFVYEVYPAIVESFVSPQPSKPDDSWAKKAAKAMAFTGAATMPLMRDIVNGLLDARDPDVGLATTELRNLTNMARDFQKKEPFSPEHTQRIIRDAGRTIGPILALPQTGFNVGAYGYGVSQGTEKPQGPWSWLVGARYGTGRGHSATGQDWMQGNYDRRR